MVARVQQMLIVWTEWSMQYLFGN